MVNMSAKFDEETHNRCLYWVHSLLLYVSTVSLTFDLQNQ